MKNVALVPLRLGSKGIPRKNLVDVCSKPLFYWILRAIIDSESFSQIIVSTEALEIEQHVKREFGKHVEIHQRDPDLASDIASTDDVLLAACAHLEVDWVGLFQATSPLLQAQEIKDAVRFFLNQTYDSLLSVCTFKRFLWSESGIPLNYNPTHRPRRQDFDGSFIENGAFYFMQHKGLLKYQCRLFGKIGIFELDENLVHEVDSLQDLEIIRTLMKIKLDSYNCSTHV